MKYSNRLRTVNPNNTIKKCREILNELGVFVSESWLEPIAGVYSVHLTIEHTGIFTNGKSTSKAYALASAYGELLERIQNLAYFRFYNCHELYYSNEKYAVDSNDFYSDSIDEVKEQKKWWTECGQGKNRKLKEFWRKYQKYHNGKIVNVVFEEIDSKNQLFIPLNILEYYYGSNGMAAGNTKSEALFQGLCEILERYVVKSVIDKKIVVPDITKYAYEKYDFIQSAYNEFKELGYTLYVKDLSVIEDIPACACIIVDSQYNYFCSFGVHPIEELALERTLTELCQGKNFEQFEYWSSAISCQPMTKDLKNMTSIMVGNGGVFPIQLLCGKENRKTHSFSKYESGTINEWNNSLKNFIYRKNRAIYIRDVSFLGFPTYQIISPSFSEIRNFENIEYLIRTRCTKEAFNLFRDIRSIDKQKAKEFIKFFEKCDKKNTTLADFIFLPLEDKSAYTSITINLILVMLYIYIENYSLAKVRLLQHIEEIDEKDYKFIDYYKALSVALEYFEHESEETIVSYIENFSPYNFGQEVLNLLKNRQEVFDEMPTFLCKDCNLCTLKCHLLFEKELYKKLQYKAKEFNELRKNKISLGDEDNHE